MPVMRRSIGMLVLCCLVAGCGDDNKKDDSPAAAPATSGAEVRGQDAEAKAYARTLSTVVEACYADSMDYANCDTGGELDSAGVPFGTGAGQVEVLDATADGYRIVAHSTSGNTYEIAKTAKGMKRSCEAEAETEACAGGTW